MSTAPVACAANHFCPLNTWFPDQFPCPDGKFTALTNADEATDCTNCIAGQLCMNGDAPIPCPVNHYCPSGTTSALPCADGETSAAGAVSCSPCPAGSVCPV
jgi:hypothetical protein